MTIDKSKLITSHDFCELGQAVIETELSEIARLRDRINEEFAQACEILLACQGKVVVTGMGKSGHIGRKLAATLASTGTPSFFMHPAEASHGDLGMVTSEDVVIAISSSGETDELLVILPLIKRQHIPLISFTGNPHSTLASHSQVVLDISVEREACPLGLAPTASTTVSLVLGDALAIALLKTKGFTANDFAQSHPKGQLGRRLLLRVCDLMRTGSQLPQVSPTTSLKEALIEMTRKSLGMTCIMSSNGELLGIFTDGDLRRSLEKPVDWSKTPIEKFMMRSVKTISAQALAAEALQQMEEFKITALVAIDTEQKIAGIIHMHDLISAKLV